MALLRQRIAGLERGGLVGVDAGVDLVTHPGLAPALRLRAGAAYTVDSTTLTLALMAGPSGAGAWCGVVGVDDLGLEAAEQWGVDLSRTVIVPDPGEQWVEAVAALVDIADLVVLRPPRGRIAPSLAERLAARLRERSAALVVQGEWPRCAARLRLAEVSWSGVGRGEGLLQARRAVVEVRRGNAPPQRVVLGGEPIAVPLGPVAQRSTPSWTAHAG